MRDSWTTQLRKGLLEFCVLATLKNKETYGYEISQSLRKTGDHLSISGGAVYPVLSRLVDAGLVSVRAVKSPDGPPRQYYRLTETGIEHFEKMKIHWIGVRDAVDDLVQAEGFEHRHHELGGDSDGRRHQQRLGGESVP